MTRIIVSSFIALLLFTASTQACGGRERVGLFKRHSTATVIIKPATAKPMTPPKQPMPKQAPTMLRVEVPVAACASTVKIRTRVINRR